MNSGYFYLSPSRKYVSFFFVLVISAFFVSCSSYNKYEAKKTDVLYTDAVSDTLAKAVGGYLIEAGFADDRTEKTVLLDKTKDAYIFSLVVPPDSPVTEEALTGARFFAMVLSSDIFSKEPVEYRFCNDSYETIRSVRSDSPRNR